MMTRSQLRRASAEYINGLSRDELFKRFQITRTANITGLDRVGVPVWSCARPAARVISVSAGKSLDERMARAGAISEAIEFHTFENPVGDYSVGAYRPLAPLPTCADSTWTPLIPIAREWVKNHKGEVYLFPSDLIWLIKREGKERHFMRSSNGQALGATFEDAFCQGVCEAVERDQLTLRRLSLKRLGVYPPLIDLDDTPEVIRQLHLKCSDASLILHLFYCTYDIYFPVYWAILLDMSGPCRAFSGWGSAITHERAAERAILEAIQSRCVYIAGARDDIERKKFQAIQTRDVKAIVADCERLPKIPFPFDPLCDDLSAESEMKVILSDLGQWRDRVYFKHIDLGDLHAVKVIILGLEQPMHDHWRSMRWERMYEDHIRWSEPVRV